MGSLQPSKTGHFETGSLKGRFVSLPSAEKQTAWNGYRLDVSRLLICSYIERQTCVCIFLSFYTTRTKGQCYNLRLNEHEREGCGMWQPYVRLNFNLLILVTWPNPKINVLLNRFNFKCMIPLENTDTSPPINVIPKDTLPLRSITVVTGCRDIEIYLFTCSCQ